MMDRIGRFRIEGCLGRGGMGEVYKAFDESLGRWVAIKSITPVIALREDRRERLREEARTVASLNHPAVAQIHDVISEEDHDYLVLEYVEGDSLAALLDREPIEVVTAVRLALDIAEGLQAAHRQDIVHRDLKPENVIVTPSGRAKILDFGLAKVLSGEDTEGDDQRGGGVAGTPSAMSPEQVERRPVDHRSDLFSLGTLLYQLTTRTHPFRSSLPVETMQRISHSDPPAAHEVVPEIPRRLSNLIARLLEKEPDRRPQSAGDAVDELLACQVDMGISDAARRLGATRGRSRALRLAAAATVVTAVAVVWYLATRSEPVEPLHVAVLQPVAEGEDSEGRLPVVTAGVRMAAINTLAGLEAVFPISPREVDAIEGDERQVARAVAADEVLTATVALATSTFQVTISRIAGGDGNVLWMDHMEVPADDIRLLAETVAAHLARGFSDRRAREGAFTVSASPEDYEAYVRVRAMVYDPPPDVSWVEILEELRVIRERSRGLLNVYPLESSVARYLYRTTRDETYLAHSREVISEALAMAPGDYRSLLAAVDLALAINDLEAAEGYLARIEEIAPSNPYGLRHRARLKELQGDVEESLRIHQRLVEFRPTWSNLRNMARAEVRQGRIESARLHLDQAISLAPDNLFLQATLGHLEILHGSLERAEELYLDIVANSPQPQYLADLGTAQFLLGRYQEARETYQRVLQQGSRSPAVMLNLADCYKLAGDSREAELWYERAVAAIDASGHLGPGDLGRKAQCLARLGFRDEAISALENGLTLSPNNTQLIYDAALVYAALDELGPARDYASRALEAGMDPRWFELPWFDTLRASRVYTEASAKARADRLSGS